MDIGLFAEILKNTFGPIICNRFAITTHNCLTGCMKQLTSGILVHVFGVWMCLFKVQWLAIRFSTIFSLKLYIYIYIYIYI